MHNIAFATLVRFCHSEIADIATFGFLIHVPL
jgi:hypothetical protein